MGRETHVGPFVEVAIRHRRMRSGALLLIVCSCSLAVQTWFRNEARGAENSPVRNVREGHNDCVEEVHTVLVVDDEATVRDVVGQYLARDGYRVVRPATAAR